MSDPDFHQIVIAALKPNNAREQETCRELTDHLSDEFDQRVANGSSEEVAVKDVVASLHSPFRLRRKIRHAQGGVMRDSFRKVLLPGVVSAIPLGFYGLVLEQYFGLHSPVCFFWGSGAFVLYWYMMPAFAVAGALGAWYSRHQGGTVFNRIIAATFVAILSLLMFTAPFPFALAVDRQLRVLRILQVYMGYLLSQAIIPGIAMLIGALPYLFSKENDDASQDAVPA